MKTYKHVFKCFTPQLGRRNIAIWLGVCSLLFMIFPNQTAAQPDPITEKVWKIDIEGNETYTDLVLKKTISNITPTLLEKIFIYNLHKYDLKVNEIRRDVIRLERFYQRRGFNDVQVTYRIEDRRKDWKKNLIFEIQENTPIRIDRLEISILADPRDSTLIAESSAYKSELNDIPYRKGKRYETVAAPETEGALNTVLRNLGYAYAKVSISAQVDSVSKSAVVSIVQEPGPRTRFDSVLIEGNESLHARYIRRETGIDKGELFNEKALREAQREVYNHHMMRFAILSIAEQPRDSTIDILLRVKESPMRSIQLEVGVGNYNRLEDGIRDIYKVFRGQVSWTHRNMRQKGEQLGIRARASVVEQRFGVDYLFPYVYNTKSSVVIAPFVQHKLEPSYEIFRGGITNSFIYRYSNDLTGTASYEYTLNNESIRGSIEELPDSLNNYDVSSFSFNAYYGRGLREGVRGWLFQPFLELSGLFGETRFSFQKMVLDVRKYTPLSQNIVFAKRIYAGAIYYAGQDSLPSDIRLFSGGTSSVRGWNRLELGPKRPIFTEEGDFDRYVPVGGRATFNFNAELRIRLHSIIKGFGIATFLDGGQVWRGLDRLKERGIQYGLGGGLRYQSPIGPVRVDVAYKINPTNTDLGIYNGTDYGGRYSRWGIHFSIGQAF